ncbi:MAG: MASE1 domain-containing protein [Vicinamibacterales bacterium]
MLADHRDAARITPQGDIRPSADGVAFLNSVRVLPMVAGAAYYLGAEIGLVLRLPPATPSVLWPANAILTALLLLTPPRRWWLVLLGALPAHFLVELGTWPWTLVSALFVTNCSEALLAAVTVRMLTDQPAHLHTLRRVTIFIAAGALMAPLVTSFMDAAAVAALMGEDYWSVWRARFLSNVLGQIVIVPAVTGLAQCRTAALREWLRTHGVETVAIAAGFLTVAFVLWIDASSIAGSGLPLVLFVPMLLWASVSFGPAGASLSILTTVLVTVGAVISRRELLSLWPVDERDAALQVFLIVVAIPLMCVAALIEERRHADRALRGRLRFEEQLARLSGTLVHVPGDKMEAALAKGLDHMCDSLDLDGVALFLFLDDGSEKTIASADTRPDVASLRTLRLNRDLPAMGRVLRFDPSKIIRSVDLPPDAFHDRESLTQHGLASAVVLPLMTDGVVAGALMCATTGSAAIWSDARVGQLRLLGDVVASALARRQADDALRASHAANSAILSSLDSHVAVLDRAGRIIAVNASWARFGCNKAWPADAGDVGMSYLDVCRSAAARGVAGAEAALAGLSGVLGGSLASFAHEYSCGAHDCDKWFVMSAVPLRRPEGGAVVTQTDTTERKRAELEARQIREELAHLTRVSVVGELTASLAHQLNQPLAGILSNAQAGRRFLEADAPDLPELGAIFTDIAEDVTRAADVIRRLRDMLRKGTSERELLDINDVAQESAKLVASDSIIRNISLRLDLARLPALVTGDRVQLQQVILNLLINAMEAVSADGGARRTVVLTTGHLDRDHVEISVSDSGRGLGLSAASQDAVFEPFYTTKASGLGLGLSIARSIVEAHGGSICAADADDGGAVFRVMLPLRSVPS